VGAAIGTGVGAVTGGLIGSKFSGHPLVLHKGTRLELELDRPLVFEARR
jgi:outer membrane lipoprotein SlyB